MATQLNVPMVSETSIANQALTWLGQEPITSLNDNTPSATWMRQNYDYLRDAVLESRMWTFAQVRAKSTTADLDAWGMSYLHPIPLNWISVFYCYQLVYSGGQSTIDKTWRRIGSNIVSQHSTVYLQGVLRISDTNLFSPLFVQALAARLAADAAMPLTQDRNMQADMWRLYEVKLAESATRDGQQGGNDMIQSNQLLDARYGGGW